MNKPDDRLQDLSEDLHVLSRIGHRFPGSEGERRALHEVRARLPDGSQSRIEGFVGFTSPAFVIGLHSFALLCAALMGIYNPLLGVLACTAITASLATEGLGGFSLLRWVLPKAASYNLEWWRENPESKGVLIISAPLDVPRWRANRPRWMRRPLQVVVIAGFSVTMLLALRAGAEPWTRPSQSVYTIALAVLAAAVAIGTVAHRRSGTNKEDASGPAALLELTRYYSENTPDNLDVWCVFTGCGHAYQNGMHAFLAMRRPRLVNRTVLVLALRDVGRRKLSAIVSEGPLLRQHHRSTGPALVERLRWAGVDLPDIDSEQNTDARAATAQGYRALALTGCEGESTPEGTLRAVRVAVAIGELFSEDLSRVADLQPTVAKLLSQPIPAVAKEPVSSEPALKK